MTNILRVGMGGESGRHKKENDKQKEGKGETERENKLKE